jgi:hypothetical protein
MSTGIGELQDEINDLKKLRKWLIVFFVLFVVLPIPIGGIVLYNAERSVNSSITSELDGIAYCFQVATGAKIANTTVTTTNVGKLISGILGLMNLVFFGFIASIITCWIEISIKDKRMSRLLTSGRGQ